ncbi:GNAT family N-acetyltransferase [Streptomyces noursei]|uniref:GNAT family N-acetyltransferase n=1 Tax=Streptomyces noursei TaxID=1971 RepID=UPI002E1AC196
MEDWERGGEALWRERLTDPHAYKLVARSRGEPLGMARGIPADFGSCDEPGEACELRSVWVTSQARGQGVVDLLIDAVEAWARRGGARTLRVAALPGNARALAVYRRHGFEDAAALGDLLPDRVTREVVLEKTLTSPAASASTPATGS